MAVRIGVCGLVLSAVAPSGPSRPASAESDGVVEDIVLEPPVLPRKAVDEIRAEWIEAQLATHPEGRWVPLKLEPTDAQLAKLGLPSRDVLQSRRYPKPTMVSPDGTFVEVELSAVASYAGAGWFGIRPGAWLLLLDDGVGWCSMAHVYGEPGRYKISTAGHCGKVGDTATVVAAFGNRNGISGPILLDFGTFAKSRMRGRARTGR